MNVEVPALPPSLNISRPASEAKGWDEETIPVWPVVGYHGTSCGCNITEIRQKRFEISRDEGQRLLCHKQLIVCLGIGRDPFRYLGGGSVTWAVTKRDVKKNNRHTSGATALDH